MFALIANHVLERNIVRRDPKKGLEWRSAVGTKALGLISFPEQWTPPFVVVSTSLYGEWLKAASAERQAVIARTAETLSSYFAEQGFADLGLVIRSSAVKETMADRGAYRSYELPADYDEDSIISRINDIYSAFAESGSEDDIAVVVQSRVHLSYRGHLSNERRVSKTANHWMWEMETPDHQDGRFNSQRASAPDPDQRLVCSQDDRQGLLQLFRMIGRWCTALDEGRVHVEWGLGFQTLWLLQLDFENEQGDDGVDPNALLRSIGLVDQPGVLPADSPIHVAQFRENTGWPKIDKVKVFWKGGRIHARNFIILPGLNWSGRWKPAGIWQQKSA
jgi:hypothetical protein